MNYQSKREDFRKKRVKTKGRYNRKSVDDVYYSQKEGQNTNQKKKRKKKPKEAPVPVGQYNWQGAIVETKDGKKGMIHKNQAVNFTEYYLYDLKGNMDHSKKYNIKELKVIRYF